MFFSISFKNIPTFTTSSLHWGLRIRGTVLYFARSEWCFRRMKQCTGQLNKACCSSSSTRHILHKRWSRGVVGDIYEPLSEVVGRSPTTEFNGSYIIYRPSDVLVPNERQRITFRSHSLLGYFSYEYTHIQTLSPRRHHLKQTYHSNGSFSKYIQITRMTGKWKMKQAD